MRRVWPHVSEEVEQRVLQTLLHPTEISPVEYERTVRMLCELEIRLSVEDALKVRDQAQTAVEIGMGLPIVPLPMIPMAILVILDYLRDLRWAATRP